MSQQPLARRSQIFTNLLKHYIIHLCSICVHLLTHLRYWYLTASVVQNVINQEYNVRYIYAAILIDIE